MKSNRVLRRKVDDIRHDTFDMLNTSSVAFVVRDKIFSLVEKQIENKVIDFNLFITKSIDEE